MPVSRIHEPCNTQTNTKEDLSEGDNHEDSIWLEVDDHSLKLLLQAYVFPFRIFVVKSKHFSIVVHLEEGKSQAKEPKENQTIDILFEVVQVFWQNEVSFWDLSLRMSLSSKSQGGCRNENVTKYEDAFDKLLGKVVFNQFGIVWR